MTTTIPYTRILSPMHQTRSKKYDDGLTKQQRYVMRNKEKVYQANAARRRKEREEKRRARNGGASSEPFTPSGTPTDDGSVRTEADIQQTAALIEESNLLFLDWTKDIDDAIARFDMCWNMKYGWINRTPFPGSKTEKFLQDKIESSSELLEKLRHVLGVIDSSTDDWDLALDRVQMTSSKTAQMTRILSYFNRSEVKNE